MKYPRWLASALAKPLPRPRIYKPGPPVLPNLITRISPERREFPMVAEDCPLEEYRALYYEKNNLCFVEEGVKNV